MYNVEYWYRQPYSRDYVIEWILSQISPLGAANNELFLTAQFGDPWGAKMIPLRGFDITDNSDLEPGEENQVYYRSSLTFTVKGWIFPPVDTTTRPIVLRVRTTYALSTALDAELNVDDSTEQIASADYDLVTKLLEIDTTLFDTTPGVTKDGEVLTFASAADYVQTVDIPVLRDEIISTVLQISGCTAAAITVEFLDATLNIVGTQVLPVVDGSIDTVSHVVTEDTAQIYLRIHPDSACTLNLNTLQIGHYSVDYSYRDSEIEDVIDYTVAEWTPDVGSDIAVPGGGIVQSDPDIGLGVPAMKVSTTAAGQGVDHTMDVPENQTIAFRVWLNGTTESVKLTVEDAENSDTRQEMLIPVGASLVASGLTVFQNSGKIRVTVSSTENGAHWFNLAIMTGIVLQNVPEEIVL